MASVLHKEQERKVEKLKRMKLQVIRGGYEGSLGRGSPPRLSIPDPV